MPFWGSGSSLLSEKKFPEAITPLETAVKLEPANPAAHYSLAVAYTRSGRKQEGDKEFAIHRQMMQSSQPRGNRRIRNHNQGLRSPRFSAMGVATLRTWYAALLAGIFCGF